jgi:hypothetical protein
VNANSSVRLLVNSDGSTLLHEVVGVCMFCLEAYWGGADGCSFPGSPHGASGIEKLGASNSKDAAVVEDRVPVRVAEPAQVQRSEPAEEPVTEPDQVPSELFIRIPADWDAGWTTRESWRRS